MEYNMTDEQKKLFDYLNWITKFIKKHNSFNNQDFLEKNELKDDDIFNIKMLNILYGVIKLYSVYKQNDIDIINNKKEYFVYFNKIYFKIGKYSNNDDLYYVERTNDKDNYFIDLNNLLGKYTVKIDIDLRNIHYGIRNLINKGLSIIEIRKILDDYLNVFEQ